MTFDPFMTLSLPIKAIRELDVVLFPIASGSNSGVGTKYRLTLPLFGTVLDLKKALQPMCGIEVGRMGVWEMFQFKFVFLNDQAKSRYCDFVLGFTEERSWMACHLTTSGPRM